MFGAIAPFIAPVAQYFSAREQNQANRENMVWAADREQANAREQMQFQERMSSSAHQREVDDLRKSGMNPILSAGGPGASAPAGSSGSASPASAVSEYGPAAATLNSNIMGIIDKINATQLTSAQVAKTNSETDLNESVVGKKVEAETSAAKASAARTAAEKKRIEQEIRTKQLEEFKNKLLLKGAQGAETSANSRYQDILGHRDPDSRKPHPPADIDPRILEEYKRRKK